MKKIMLCGGGSAGHVMPNVAVYENLKNQFEFSYIGTPAIERDICRKFGIPFRTFDGVKLTRGKILCNLKIPFKLIASISECKEILLDEEPDLLLCKGGYASLPPAIAAAKLKIPVLTHESDLTPGLANKIISKKSIKTMTSFQSTARQFKNGVYTGSPMRGCLFNRNKLESKQKLGLDFKPAILVFGGGSGSKKINENLREIALELCKDYNILHICGKGNTIDTNISGYKQIEFCDDMGLLYAAADYAVARCGSNSAHELIALKIPTLFIPLDNGRSRGDQVQNAEYFKNRGLCRVLRESELTPKSLKNAIEVLVSDEKLKTALQDKNLGCGNRNIEIEIKNALKSR